MYYLAIVYIIYDRSYFFVSLFFIFGTWAIGSVIENLTSFQFPGWSLPVLALGGSVIGMILHSLGHGDLGASVIWKNHIPENGQVLNMEDVPLQIFTIHLEKENSPVYVRINPYSSYDEDVEFHMYGPDNKAIFPPYRYKIVCGRKIKCFPAIFELCYNQSGEYKIKTRSFRTFSPSITIDIFKSRWIQSLYYVRQSTCP
jgi:hypothetical protein